MPEGKNVFQVLEPQMVATEENMIEPLEAFAVKGVKWVKDLMPMTEHTA